jgi:hypothetical protein
MRVPEIELAFELVVFFVECTAGYKDSNYHANLIQLGPVNE